MLDVVKARPTVSKQERPARGEKSAAKQRPIVLVFQGGGALGAYQAGVYQALHEAKIEPDWIIGTSIGAINASLRSSRPAGILAPNAAQGILGSLDLARAVRHRGLLVDFARWHSGLLRA